MFNLRTLFILGLVYGFCYTAFEVRTEFANTVVTKLEHAEYIMNQH
jgi:hypothetical protein